ncbi:DUF2975 domain-containing protein [Plantactinospora sonchi]|uniref:DUF2975 domain-containing protein n=1 Tax=Plantactinospora sonchi TaxID=1544735 RepID=A0ABU7RY71_9ACTN
MRILDRLRRPDWLAELQAVITCGLVALAVISVASTVSTLNDDQIMVALPTGLLAAPDGLGPGVTLAAHGTVDVTLSDPTAGQLVASLLTVLPSCLVAATVLGLLLSTVRRARRDQPFRGAIVRRLRALALVVLIGGPLAATAEAIAALSLSSRFTDGGFSSVLDLAPLGPWVLTGFGLLAIAEIVNRGRALRAELDTVV